MRTFISSLALGILLAPQAFAGDTGTVAIGSGVGGALGNVIGQQVGGSTGAAIGAGLGGAAGGVITARDGRKTEAALGGGLGAAGGSGVGGNLGGSTGSSIVAGLGGAAGGALSRGSGGWRQPSLVAQCHCASSSRACVAVSPMSHAGVSMVRSLSAAGGHRWRSRCAARCYGDGTTVDRSTLRTPRSAVARSPCENGARAPFRSCARTEDLSAWAAAQGCSFPIRRVRSGCRRCPSRNGPARVCRMPARPRGLHHGGPP